MHLPCDACAAPCCRLYHVGVYASDVYRISRALALPMSDIADLRLNDPRDENVILDGAAAEGERGHYGLGLRKVPDPDPKYPHRCLFLVTLGARGRCGIYDVRPGVCRVYPTTSWSGIVGVDGGGRYCPPPGWQLRMVDQPLARSRWVEVRAHRALHVAIAGAWNNRLISQKERGSEATFIDFIERVLEAIRGEWGSLDAVVGMAAGDVARAVARHAPPAFDGLTI